PRGSCLAAGSRPRGLSPHSCNRGAALAERGGRATQGGPAGRVESPCGRGVRQASARAGAGMSGGARSRFVGREPELEALADALRAARAGRGGLALLAGEGGIGKTAIARELAARARREGVAVLWGGCFEG